MIGEQERGPPRGAERRWAAVWHVKPEPVHADEGSIIRPGRGPDQPFRLRPEPTRTTQMDSFAELARIADQIKDAIDGDDFAERIGGLRRALDLAFARVLDHERDPEQRDEFLDGFRSLTLSLDELERLHA
jgi:hypothetical protein